MADFQLNYTGSQINSYLAKANTAVQPAGIANFITKDVNNLTNYTTTSDLNTELNAKVDKTSYESWQFTLDDESTVTKKVVVVE